MPLKRSVFGTYVKDGILHDRKEVEQRKKGFRTLRSEKLS